MAWMLDESSWRSLVGEGGGESTITKLNGRIRCKLELLEQLIPTSLDSGQR
jgi:hypothetical protein